MARLTSVDYDKTKQRLLEVGLHFFETKGYNATGIQEITTKAKIPKGSFYTYFPSKEEFGVGVISYYADNSISNWIQMLDEATREVDAYSALSITFLSITETYKHSDAKTGCLLGNLAAEISEASEECRIELQLSVNKYIEILKKHLLIGQSMGKVRTDISADLLAELVWDTWQGSLLRMKIEKSVVPVKHDLDVLFQVILAPIQN